MLRFAVTAAEMLAATLLTVLMVPSREPTIFFLVYGGLLMTWWSAKAWVLQRRQEAKARPTLHAFIRQRYRGAEMVERAAERDLYTAADMLEGARGTEIEAACRANHAEKLAALEEARAAKIEARRLQTEAGAV